MNRKPKRCYLITVASWLVLALTANQAPAAAQSSAMPCNDVRWLNPNWPPPFLTDIDQAPGTGDCQFQEFASWNFMSLVLGNRPNFESWPTLEQVFPASGPPICSGAPLGSMLVPSIRQDGEALRAIRAKEAKVAGLAAPPEQAFGGPLVDRAGRYIQYEMRVNPTLCSAFSACNIQIQACGLAAAADKNFAWPSGIPGNSTPGSGVPGAAELKLAWRVMETCDLPDSPRPCTPTNLDAFFWTGPVEVDSLGPKWDKPATVTIGLVGFHLMQKTPSHPEFIWATWEHISNDPVCPGSDNSTCQDPSRGMGGIGPSGWSLFDPNVNPAPQINTAKCPPASFGGPPPTQPNCFNHAYFDPKNPQAQPDTEVCRLAPCGGGDQSEIAELNEAIRNKLAGNVWWNYFLVGTVWGNGTFPPTGPNNSAGSIYLANSTMETFLQANASTPKKYNCFTCHNAGGSGGYTPPPPTINVDFIHSLQRAQQTQPTTCPVNINTCLPMISAHSPTIKK